LTSRLLRPSEVERRERLRQTRKALRVGAPPSPCAICCYFSRELGLLRPFKVRELSEPLRQKVLQRHHLDGRAVSGFTIWLCIWCHAEESDAQHDLPDRLRHPRTREDRLLALLASDARLMRRMGEVMVSRAEWVEQEVARLIESSNEKHGKKGRGS
jgi:hypothetical protein